MGQRQLDYYNLLVDGFRKGSLALDIEVPERLRQAKSPLEMVGLAPHDVSYFKGRFYTYYGVVPAVVLFWPYRVFGGELPLVLGSLAFAIGAFIVMALLWLRIVGDIFPRAGLATRVAGLSALCLAGGQLVLARRVSIWEPSIEAGNFFLACAVMSGYLALRARKPWLPLAACGLTLGLAAGSRPTLAVAGIGLVPLVAAIGFAGGADRGSPRHGRLWKAALAAGLPLALVGFALLAYNWARFGNPLEFGLNYQISTWNQVEKKHFLPAYIPYNAYLYFLAPPEWGRYFPFVHPIASPRQPAGYYGYEYVYGALIVCPALWWGACLLPLVRRADPLLRRFAAFVGAIAVATTLVILCFDTAAARYETDFLPWWVLLALLGWGLLADRMRSRGAAARGLLTFAFASTAAVSCVLAFCRSAELHEILETSNPGAYRSLSRLFNTPTALWERLSGYQGGAIEMNLTFARRPIESVEPLVVTGVEYQRDYVYLYYQRDNVVRFCYVHPGEPVASSADVTVEPGRPYHLRVECGSLYPPQGHALYDGWLPWETTMLKHSVKIELDGKVLVCESRGSNEASPGTVQIGVDTGNGYCGRRFAGTISGVRRLGCIRAVGDLAPAGDFNFVVALPSGPSRLNSPLVTAGWPGEADIVGLNVNEAGQYRFSYESWGVGEWRSGLLGPPGDRVIALRVRLGPTLQLDQGSPLAILDRSFVVWANGKPAWWRRTASPLPAKPPFGLLSNGVRSTAFEPVFKGQLISANRTPLPIVWRRGPFSAVNLQLGGRGEGCEPLIATGGAGNCDMVGIDWLENGRARLIYEHWGRGVWSSVPFEWRDSDLKSVRVEMPSFSVLDEAGKSGGEGRIIAGVDGAAVWDATVPYFRATSDSVAIGRNAAGCTSTSAELQAVVVNIRQEPRG